MGLGALRELVGILGGVKGAWGLKLVGGVRGTREGGGGGPWEPEAGGGD